MPRIADEIRDCAIYLYETAEDAELGLRSGGSGFLVGIPTAKRADMYHLFAVTNSHVIREGRSPIIRLNNAQGQKEVLDKITADDWKHHPEGDDIAILPIWLRPEHYVFRFVHRGMFLTRAIIEEHNIGPGDDVFMVGRFSGHDGRQRNWPSIRFGNISMMPWEPIRHERGYDQEAFLVEARSLPGYSGSPVWVFIPPLTKRPKQPQLSRGGGPWLTGIDFCHLHTYEPVREKSGDLVNEEWMVQANSGMMGVIPIWRLDAWFDSEEMVEMRKKAEKDRKEESPVSLDKQTFIFL